MPPSAAVPVYGSIPPGVSRKSRRETAPGTTLNSARSMAMRLFSSISGVVSWWVSTTRKPEMAATSPSVRSIGSRGGAGRVCSATG